MKNTLKIILLILLCVNSEAHSQGQIYHVKPLNIGDEIPEETWQLPLLMNYQDGKKVITLNEHRGKLIILDFWATWCGSCISAMPRVHALQEQFEKDIVVIPVAYQPNNIVARFIKENGTIKNLNIHSIVEDSLLKKLFPHRLLPHYVWIYNNKVQSITASKDITYASINGVLEKKNVSVDIKRDVLDFDKHKSLLENNASVIKQKRLYESLLTEHLPGIGSAQGITKDSTSKRYYYVNRPIMALYEAALDLPFGNRILLSVRDTGKFIRDNKIPWGEWEKNNTYCYELIVPLKTTKQQVKKIMLEDLNRYLNINTMTEDLSVNCLAIVSSEKANIHGDIVRSKKADLKIIDDLNYQLPSSPLKPIIIDESNYTGELDIKDSNTGVAKLSQQLKTYNLDLIAVKRRLKMVVISDR